MANGCQGKEEEEEATTEAATVAAAAATSASAAPAHNIYNTYTYTHTHTRAHSGTQSMHNKNNWRSPDSDWAQLLKGKRNCIAVSNLRHMLHLLTT